LIALKLEANNLLFLPDAVTKAAQMQFINNLQIQLDQKAGGKSKIRCASIGPGMTWTAIFQKGRFANVRQRSFDG
jgi:NADP-dependent 3-hydroxy acid dehydrogenase YdfG